LINRVRRAIVMSDGPWINPLDLDLDRSTVNETKVMLLDAVRESAERKAIDQAIRICSNNYAAAARMLGVSRVTLYRLLEKHRGTEQRMN
jgi:DNA-binding NtrC family response regulator